MMSPTSPCALKAPPTPPAHLLLALRPTPPCLSVSVSLCLPMHSFTLIHVWAGNLSLATGTCFTCIPVLQVLPIHLSSLPTYLISHVSHFLFPCLTRSHQHLHTSARCSPVYLRHHLLRYHVQSFLQQTSTEPSTCHLLNLSLLSLFIRVSAIPLASPLLPHRRAPDTQNWVPL